MILECNNISKTYKPNINALKNISLEINAGIWGLLGANGAGKTTIMQILSSILDPDKGGEVKYNGENIRKFVKSYRSILGYVPQECTLPDHLKVTELILMISQFKQIEFKTANKQIFELLGKMNLEEKSNCQIKELSGGMKQRLSVLQGFLGDPEIIILDEPTKGLDIYEQNNLYNLIVERSLNKILLISSHIINDIEQTCQNVIILHKGTILYCGAINILTENYYNKFFIKEFDKNDPLLDIVDILSIEQNFANKKVTVYSDHYLDNWIIGIPSLKNIYLHLINSKKNK